MRVLSRELPSPFFKSSSQWNESSKEDKKQFIVTSYILRSLIFWIIFINIVNFLYINLTLHFDDCDLIEILKHNSNETSEFDKQLENILRGIYLRNEPRYLENINDTTILTALKIQINNKVLKIKLTERLYGAYVSDYKFSTFIEKDVKTNTLIPNTNKIRDTLTKVLTRLYQSDQNLNVDQYINKVLKIILIISINKIILLTCSILILVLYISFNYVPKELHWHYINLFTLLGLDAVIIANLVIIIISRMILHKVDLGLGFLLLELFLFSGLGFIVVQTHKSFMKSVFFDFKYSTSSSVYSNDTPDQIHQQDSNGHAEKVLDENSFTESKKSLNLVIPIPEQELRLEYPSSANEARLSPIKLPYMPYQSISRHMEPKRRKSLNDIMLLSSTIKNSPSAHLTPEIKLKSGDVTVNSNIPSVASDQKEKKDAKRNMTAPVSTYNRKCIVNL